MAIEPQATHEMVGGAVSIAWLFNTGVSLRTGTRRDALIGIAGGLALGLSWTLKGPWQIAFAAVSCVALILNGSWLLYTRSRRGNPGSSESRLEGH
jgi:membrane protein implicated in regulation of membrane protease activity